jgi:hypothetical protein
MNAKLTQADLAQFTGTETWFRHGICRNVLYTDGVQYLAEHGECYWLIDKIATLQSIPRIKSEEFQVWRLKVTNNTATLTCEDGNDNAVYSEHITFTDFPLDEVAIWFENGVICLPSER